MDQLTTFQNAEKIEFKPEFIERYSKLTDWKKFKKYSLSYLRRAIRVNTLKITVKEIKERLSSKWKLEQIPWCKQGFWISGERRDIGNLTEHSLGYIYVQEAASMLPPIALAPMPHEFVLDMCASPGSKTTQMAAMMQNKGILVANDITGIRLQSLGVNIQRCGITNCLITLMQGRKIQTEFDKILVDAPCSGTGAIRKSAKTIEMWNPNLVKRLAGTQTQLLQTAFNNLKEGGTVVYSTCTLEPEENEGVVSKFLDKNPEAKLEEIKVDIKRANPIMEFEGETYNPEVKKCLRIWPQDNNTEGFFVAKIRK